MAGRSDAWNEIRKIIFGSSSIDDATSAVNARLSGDANAGIRAQLTEELGFDAAGGGSLIDTIMADAKRSSPYAWGDTFGGPATGPFSFNPKPAGSALTAAMSGGFSGVVGGGLIGGVTSYATGGEFMQGAAAGAMGGFAMRGLYGLAGSKAGGLNQMVASRAESGGALSGLAQGMMNSASAGTGMQTMAARHAMMSGAALGGMMFGGNRKSHKRGFNSHRGNTF